MPLTTRKRRKYTRRILLTLLVFMTAMAQNVPWLPGLWGVRALPLIPLAIAIAVQDQEVPALLFGAFAGLLWDMTVGSPGWYALFFTTLAFACAMLMRYILNRNALTVGLLTFLASALYLGARWLADYGGLAGGTWALLRYSLPSLGYTMAFTPLVYAIVRAIVKRTSRKQRGVLAE